MGIGHVASSAPGGSYLSGAAAMMGRGGVTSRTSSRKAAGSGERGKGPSVAMAAGPGCQRSYRRRREDGGGSVRGASGRRPPAVRPSTGTRPRRLCVSSPGFWWSTAGRGNLTFVARRSRRLRGGTGLRSPENETVDGRRRSAPEPDGLTCASGSAGWVES